MPDKPPEVKLIPRSQGKYVHDGMMNDFNGNPHYAPYSAFTDSRHLSVVFNIFVWLQVFNMICARKINDEINIFQGIHTNIMFICVFLGIAGM